MNTVITINGITDSTENFVTWTPSNARVRLENTGVAADPVTVTIQNKNPGQGRQLLFAANRSGPGTPSLVLNLSVNGDPVDFFLAGEFESDEMKQYDAAFTVSDSASGDILSETPVFVRVRRNANELEPDEQNIVLSALQKLNSSGTYRVIRNVHVQESEDEAHGFPGFLPWHRAYLLDLEREMQKLEPLFALPYWRFDLPSPKVFSPDFMGGVSSIGTTVFSHSNPLQRWVLDGGQSFNRDPYFDTQTESAWTLFQGQTIWAISEQETLDLASDDELYRWFRQLEGNPHGLAHVSFVGELDTPSTAPRDPLFYMLHNNVDRLWALWQTLTGRWNGADIETYSTEDWPFPRVGHELNDTMWPWNLSQTAPRPSFEPPGGDFARSTIVIAPGLTPKVSDMIDYKGILDPSTNLGFDYDDVPFVWS